MPLDSYRLLSQGGDGNISGSKVQTVELPITMTKAPMVAIPYDVTSTIGDAFPMALQALNKSSVTFTSTTNTYGYRWLVIGV